MSIIKKAAIDRFEGKYAILLVDENPSNVLRSLLPEGVKEGDWLEVEFDGDRFIRAKMDPEEKERMKKRIEEKLSRLRDQKK
jgi:Protein of unknown function (DUF3006)